MFKKSIKFFLLLFIGVCSFSFMNVDAATSFPADYEVGDFKYTIEGFNIKIYKNDGIFSNKVEKKIEIPKDKVTINPVGKTIMVSEGKQPMASVKLNFQLEDETIEQLVKKEIPTITNEDDVYYISVEVDYKLTKIPQGYPYMFRFNMFNFFAGIGSLAGEDYNVEDANVNLNQSTSQMIDMAVYAKKDGQVVYLTENEGTSLKESAIGDYVFLSTTDTFTLIDLTGESSNEKSYGFVIHDLDNIEEVYKKNEEKNKEAADKWFDEHNNDNETIDDEPRSVTKQTQAVKVPDTDARSKSQILFGISIMLLGSAIVLFELRKKFNN